jgi:hypothetical protein
MPEADEILNNSMRPGVLRLPMTKIIALLVAGMFATGAVFAGEHGDCTKQAGNTGKPACSVSLASLNLTPDQQTKMDAAMAEHHKAGCSEASEAAYMKEAEGVLTKDQFAKFKAECKGHKDKAKTET